MRPVLWFRLAVFLICALHMQLGPLVRQVLRKPQPPLTMAWQMYSGRGHDVCEVDWYENTRDGLVPLDRLAVLGKTERHRLPSNVRIQRSLGEIEAAAKQMCNKRQGIDVRARARCAVRRGMRWKDIFDVEEPLCSRSPAEPSPAPRGKAKARSAL